MSKQQAIIEILRSLGIYERIKKKVSSDAELAKMFDENFEQLILRVGG